MARWRDCEVCPAGTHGEYDAPSRPFDLVTIGRGGWRGEHTCHPNGHTSGYGHGFLAHGRTDAHTVIVDLTVMTDQDLFDFAVNGPMLGMGLPAGTISTFMASSLEPRSYTGQAGGLDKVALDVYLRLAVERGAAACTGDQFTCDDGPDRALCRDCLNVAIGRCGWCGGDDLHPGTCRVGEPKYAYRAVSS